MLNKKILFTLIYKIMNNFLPLDSSPIQVKADEHNYQFHNNLNIQVQYILGQPCPKCEI